MADATELTEETDLRWWQWHLGDRMARHQHPDAPAGGCSWPECAWHGLRPGEENLVASLPEGALRSVALDHLEGLGSPEGGGRFVYERDVLADEELEFYA